jgi:hypothetical protein
MTPINSLSQLRDLPLKVQLPPDLAQELRAIDRPPASISAAEEPQYIDAVVRTAERCVAFLDWEMHRLTEHRFSMPDPNVLRQKIIGDPRRTADQVVNAVKQKLSNEKQEWGRRIAKQMSDVATTIDQQIDSITMSDRADSHHDVIVTADAAWQHDFERWKGEVFTTWARHLAPLVQAKTVQLVQPDLDALREVLGQPVVVVLPMPQPMALPMGREQPKEHSERFEVPTAAESFFEMFKGNLSTVAMIAGMVIIPVVGSLMNEAATHIRAAIMGAAVAPIVGFAALRARAVRRKLIAQSREKARDRLKKSVAAEAKGDLERFKPDAERYAAHYCNVALSVVLSVVEPLVLRTFERREREAAADLARAQMQVERLQEALNVLRQAKSTIAGQLLVDVRRRQVELLSGTHAPGGPGFPAKA